MVGGEIDEDDVFYFLCCYFVSISWCQYEGFRRGLKDSMGERPGVFVFVSVFVCVCVCACVRACVRACVCVAEKVPVYLGDCVYSTGGMCVRSG